MGLIDTNELTKAIRRLKTKFAAVAHKHSASDITSGTLPVARGGTGLAASPSMLVNLGSTSADNVLKSDPRPGVTGTLPIERGGTGAVTAAAAAENIVGGQAIEPASVAATGEVSAKSGSTTHKLTEKAEDADLDKLESSIAYVEAVTAKKNHAVGDYFMLGDVLMRTTAAIATGETINASKAVPATLQGQIDTLRDSVACGFVRVVHDGGDEKTTLVTFSHEFSVVPYVVAVLRGGWYRKHLAIGSVTTTGFNLITSLDTGTATDITVDYIAMRRL